MVREKGEGRREEGGGRWSDSEVEPGQVVGGRLQSVPGTGVRSAS